MDNQNTNGLNGVNNIGETINPLPNTNPELQNQNNNIITPIVPENKLIQEEENSDSAIANSIPAASATPIRPSLDAILNGTPVEKEIPQNNSVIENVRETPLNDRIITPINEVNTAPVEPVSEVNAPIIESIEKPVESETETNSINSQNIVAESNEKIPTPPTNESIAPVQEKNTILESIPVQNVQDINQVANENSSVSQTNIGEGIPSQTANTYENNVVQPLEPAKEETVQSTPERPTTGMPNIENTAINVETLTPEIENANPKIPQDDFAAVPLPPIQENNKKKRKKEPKVPKEKGANVSSKSLIVVLLIILIAAVGFGVYYFLNTAKEKANTVSIVTKEVKAELGEVLSRNIEDYATIEGYNKENCTLMLDNVNVNKVSAYKFNVTCGNKTEEGTIIIDDTTKPQVIVNDVILAPNSTLNAADFIERCIDASKCSYSFNTATEGLTEKIGEYDIEIVVNDEYNNSTTATAKLIISRNAPVKYLTCVSKGEVLEDIAATYTNIYKIGIDAKDTFLNATRTANFIFKDKASYESVANSYDKNVGIHEIVGTESFVPTENKIAIKLERTLAEISFDINGNNNRTMSNNATIIRAWLSGLDYTCNE